MGDVTQQRLGLPISECPTLWSRGLRDVPWVSAHPSASNSMAVTSMTGLTYASTLHTNALLGHVYAPWSNALKRTWTPSNRLAPHCRPRVGPVHWMAVNHQGWRGVEWSE